MTQHLMRAENDPAWRALHDAWRKIDRNISEIQGEIHYLTEALESRRNHYESALSDRSAIALQAAYLGWRLDDPEDEK